MKYIMVYDGLASTPNSISIICTTTNELICRIETALPSGKETRKRFNKIRNKLLLKYKNIL